MIFYFTVDENDFTLRDPEAEEDFKFSLEKSIRLAKSKKVLDGIQVCATPKVLPEPEIFKRVIDDAGGKVKIILLSDSFC